jgi:mRNA interferase MazF
VVARGEIWWYEPPDAKRRPFLVLTRDEAIPVLNQLVAVPATTVIRDIPTEVPLDEADGMPVPCVLSFDNITVVRRALLTERITRLDPGRHGEICRALGMAVAC